MQKVPYEIAVQNQIRMKSVKWLIIQSVVGVAFVAYSIIETTAKMGKDPSAMKPSDQLMWLWMVSYVFMCWPVKNKEDVYR